MAFNYSPKIITDGLVLYLDAANTKSYPTTGTTWRDVSRGGNDGTLTNGPTFSNSNSGTFSFDGTNDYISTPIQNLSRPCTFSIWVKFNSLSGFQTFAGQDTSTAITRGRFYFQKAGSTNIGLILNVVNFSLVLSDNSIVVTNALNPVVTNQWYNYSVALTTTTISLYENGIIQNTVNDSNVFLTPNTTITLNAGYFNNNIVDFVNGSSSSFLIYDRALLASEILQNYNATRTRFGL